MNFGDLLDMRFMRFLQVQLPAAEKTSVATSSMEDTLGHLLGRGAGGSAAQKLLTSVWQVAITGLPAALAAALQTDSTTGSVSPVAVLGPVSQAFGELQDGPLAAAVAATPPAAGAAAAATPTPRVAPVANTFGVRVLGSSVGLLSKFESDAAKAAPSWGTPAMAVEWDSKDAFAHLGHPYVKACSRCASLRQPKCHLPLSYCVQVLRC